MAQSAQYRRVRIAVLISIALNTVLFVLASIIDARGGSFPRTERILDVLGEPSKAITEWIVPTGHDAAYFLGGALVSILSSIVFYAVLTWVTLSLPAWWRSRQ
jgi:hypothetical protein